MIKRVILTAIVLFVAVWGGLGLVQADSGLAVLETSAEMDFPLSLRFNVSARSDVDITDVRLHYYVERMEHARITSEVYLEFSPARSIDEQWEWDMRRTGGLPPGSSVTYWWTVSDVEGNRVVTDKAVIPIEDNRYDWQSMVEGKVTIFWYKGDDSFAGEIMATAQGALSHLKDDTGAELVDPIKIYIYANSTDLQGSMIFPQEWTGGVAFTRYGIIAIGIAPGNLDWGKGAIAHELTHLVINQVTFSPYGGLPTWLDEGLAMKSEGELGAEFVSVLNKAYEEGNLISVQSLASPFSAYSGDASLAYAQSYSIVNYLINEYGREKMFELLNTFRQGSGYNEALMKVYGFDMGGLDELWRGSMEAEEAVLSVS